MKRSEALVRREKRPSNMIWSIFGGAALVVAAAAVIVSLPDSKRYIKISRM